MSKPAHHKNARRAGVAVAGVTAAALATGGVAAASAAGGPGPAYQRHQWRHLPLLLQHHQDTHSHHEDRWL